MSLMTMRLSVLDMVNKVAHRPDSQNHNPLLKTMLTGKH